MFTAGKSSRRRGFTLVELLVAIAVAALVVPAILAILPRSFSALSDSVTEARSARAAMAFDAAFGRDFSSLVPECGFSGDEGRCSFWTLRPSASGGFEPALVEYRRGQGEVRRAEFPISLHLALCGTNAPSAIPPDTSGEPPSRQPLSETFAVTTSPFRYGAGQTAASPELPEWFNPTNAPASVELATGATGGLVARRLFFRRASP